MTISNKFTDMSTMICFKKYLTLVLSYKSVILCQALALFYYNTVVIMCVGFKWHTLFAM